MTVWQKISGIASAVGDAGSGLLGDLGRAFGLDRSTEATLERLAAALA